MTCLEKYKLEHGNADPILEDICPNLSGGIDIDYPGYCRSGLDGECEMCWNREVPCDEPGTSAVDHPKHYVRERGIECIEEMILVFGKEATLNFCLLNAWKYRYRAADKNGAEDIEKSDWYMAKYAELKGGDSNVTQ